MTRKLALLVLVVTALVALPTAFVSAQTGTLDPAADPNYAIIGLDPNFFELMDGSPAVISIVSGGDVDANATDPSCRGFGTSQPDLVVFWSGQVNTLRFFFSSLGDTTLIINMPDGTYACNDDGDGLNPVVDIVNPAEGEYAIWVGSFSSTALNPGYLFMTPDTTLAPSTLAEPLLMASGSTGGVTPTVVQSTGGTASSGGLSGSSSTSGSTTTTGPINLQPAGPVSLTAGFVPDPYAAAIAAGGPVDVASLNLTSADGQSCRGFAPDNPQLALTWSGQSPNLRVFFVATQFADSTMVVQLPNGTFLCNDDFPGGNLNPLVDIPNAGPGVYNIYVGTFSQNQSNPGTLYITELMQLDPTTVGQ